MKPSRSLQVLSFFAADVQAGAGPFLGVFLLAHGWRPDSIGMVLTIGGIAGMLVTPPAGALVDATRYRRAVVIAAGMLTIGASVAIWISHSFWMVTLSQIATATAGSLLGPGLAGLTLGIVGRGDFNRRFGHNQVANHAGNITAAVLTGWLAWRFGIAAAFALNAAFGLLSIVATLTIPSQSVNHHHARGLIPPDETREHNPDSLRVHGLGVLLNNRTLLLLAATLAIFNIGNSTMLPLYSLAIVSSGHGNAGSFTALTIVVSQVVMLFAAMSAHRLIRGVGYWWVLLVTLAMLPLRGVIAAAIAGAWGVWPMQTFDGIAAGLQSVAVPALVVCLLHGTGRVNLGQGVVLSVQAAGACISPALGGWLSSRFGYPVAFLALGSTAIVPLAIWLGGRGQIVRACRQERNDDASVGSERTSTVTS